MGGERPPEARRFRLEQRRIASSRILNGLSVDVEDWFQVGAFENTIDRADWDGLALRVMRIMVAA